MCCTCTTGYLIIVILSLLLLLVRLDVQHRCLHRADSVCFEGPPRRVHAQHGQTRSVSAPRGQNFSRAQMLVQCVILVHTEPWWGGERMSAQRGQSRRAGWPRRVHLVSRVGVHGSRARLPALGELSGRACPRGADRVMGICFRERVSAHRGQDEGGYAPGCACPHGADRMVEFALHGPATLALRRSRIVLAGVLLLS